MKKWIILIIVFILALSACTSNSSTTAAAVKTQITSVVKSTTSTPVAAQATAKAAATARATTIVSSKSTDQPDEDTSTKNSASITLSGSLITVDGTGAEVKGSTVTITSAGMYTVAGTLSNGQIVVNAGDADDVKLILNGVNISNSSTSPIYVINSDKMVIQLADNSKNVVSDGSKYVFVDSTVDEPNAAIFCKTDLTITGNGSLTVNGNFNDGIASKDDLNIKGGTINVTAADDGIRGKDSVEITGGTLTVNVQGDGIKADNAEDASEGFITVEAGVLNVTAGGNAIQAETTVTILDGTLSLTSGGGSNVRANSITSAKGISAVVGVTIEGGSFTINSADDAINSNGSVVINNGAFNISTGDDGVHANATIEINGGDFQITKSYEGIESAVITLNAGTFHIISSDDGINVAGGVDSSGMAPGGRPGGRQDTFSSTGTNYLYINGGYIYVDALGDGVDVNGAVEMNDGVLIVNGPTQNMNGALDYDRGFVMKGGWLVAAGSSGMAQAPGTSSTINSVLVNVTSALKAGTVFHIQNSKGEDILTFTPTKQYQSVAFASPDLVQGSSYEIYTGGSSTGTKVDGLYQDGSYSGGTKLSSFTVSGAVTMIGTQSRMR